jgi:hypothetical protein
MPLLQAGASVPLLPRLPIPATPVMPEKSRLISTRDHRRRIVFRCFPDHLAVQPDGNAVRHSVDRLDPRRTDQHVPARPPVARVDLQVTHRPRAAFPRRARPRARNSCPPRGAGRLQPRGPWLTVGRVIGCPCRHGLASPPTPRDRIEKSHCLDGPLSRSWCRACVAVHEQVRHIRRLAPRQSAGTADNSRAADAAHRRMADMVRQRVASICRPAPQPTRGSQDAIQ